MVEQKKRRKRNKGTAPRVGHYYHSDPKHIQLLRELAAQVNRDKADLVREAVAELLRKYGKLQ